MELPEGNIVMNDKMQANAAGVMVIELRVAEYAVYVHCTSMTSDAWCGGFVSAAIQPLVAVLLPSFRKERWRSTGDRAAAHVLARHSAAVVPLLNSQHVTLCLLLLARVEREQSIFSYVYFAARLPCSTLSRLP